jgi:nicotinamide riboside kinase
MAAPLLVSILGAECSGKTALAQALAGHFSGWVVPEYLRSFCEQRGRTPLPSEQARVLREQLAQQAGVVAQAQERGCRYVFCDTSALLTAVYSDHYFSDHSLYAQAQAEQRRYALTLLLEPDLPWQADGLQRDGRQVQAKVHALLVQALATVHPLVGVAGSGAARIQSAIRAVSSITRPV